MTYPQTCRHCHHWSHVVGDGLGHCRLHQLYSRCAQRCDAFANRFSIPWGEPEALPSPLQPELIPVPSTSS